MKITKRGRVIVEEGDPPVFYTFWKPVVVPQEEYPVQGIVVRATDYIALQERFARLSKLHKEKD